MIRTNLIISCPFILSISSTLGSFTHERDYQHDAVKPVLTLKVLVTTIDAQWEVMGDVGSARYEPALLPSCPTIRVLNYSNY